MKNILKSKSFIKIFLVLVLSFPVTRAQNLNVIDSLTTRLANSNERERISILLALAKSHQNSEQKEAIKYANKSILLSEKYNDQLHIGRAHILIGDAYTVSGKFDEAEKHLEQAKDIFSVVKSEKDEVDLYGYLGELYIKTNNYDKAEEYYLKRLKISKKIGGKKKIAWSINNLVSIYLERGKMEEAESSAFEALKLAESLKDKNLQINLHVKIADIIAYQHGDLDKISEHYQRALKLAVEKKNPRASSAININWAVTLSNYEKFKEAEKHFMDALKTCEQYGYHNRIILVYSGLGETSLGKGNYEKAMNYFVKALGIVNKTNNKRGKASIYRKIGAIHIEQGSYEKSIEYLYKSLGFYEALNDKSSLSVVYNYIGEAFYQLNNFSKAEENYQNGVVLCEELGDQKGIAISYLSLGALKVKQKLFEEAMLYLEKAHDKVKKMGHSRELILYYNAMAECKYNQGEIEEALDLMLQVLSMEHKLKEFKKPEIESYTRLGTIYYELQKYEKAEMFFRKSLKTSIVMKSKMEIKNNYFWLSKCYEKLNKYEKSLEYYKKYSIIKDSIFNLNKIKQIADIQIKYDTDKKEKEILFLQKEKEYQTILFNSQKNELYRVNLEKDLERERKERDIIQLKSARKQSEIEQLNMQNNLEIAEKEIKNNQLSIQKSRLARELLIRNIIIGGGVLAFIVLFLALMYYRQRLKTQKIIARKEIEAINANINGQEKERERIAKELHDGIGGNLAAIKLDLSKLSNGSNHELQKVIKNVNGTYNEVRTLSHDLIPPKILKTSFEKLIKDYLNNLSKTCSFTISNDFYPSSRFNQLTDKIKIELYRITQELMNNIIKHAQADQVSLQFIMIDKRIKFIIEDNGIGFDTENISKGIGLNNILSRTKVLSGNMHIDTIINRGTVIEIDIPA
ncbi:hypothetical protein ATO12_01290 [Aquimarina atlantica]|uniref:Histidine kinase domain-containing protein n=1 Tax=Aquimarina atlantica TaxID=1317122 RepID=A0A023BZF8_9FLAO|nr:tetratricopeptide repeat protein [Aquimarina atlantica]EZH75441.1 hypothetical protein ATO12_01290 [Aquimarina atlantica]